MISRMRRLSREKIILNISVRFSLLQSAILNDLKKKHFRAKETGNETVEQTSRIKPLSCAFAVSRDKRYPQ